MFVHAVYFWLKDDLSEAQRERFREGVHALTTIESVRDAYIGVPASTSRHVVDRSYSQSLVLIFADPEGQEAYQQHPTHERFRQECGTFWRKVVVYDSTAEQVRRTQAT